MSYFLPSISKRPFTPIVIVVSIQPSSDSNFSTAKLVDIKSDINRGLNSVLQI